jgi:hypothetical protein
VDGAGRNFSIKPHLHLVENGAAIGLLAQPKNREQHGLLEIAKKVSHKAYNVAFEAECQRNSDRFSTTMKPLQDYVCGIRLTAFWISGLSWQG